MRALFSEIALQNDECKSETIELVWLFQKIRYETAERKFTYLPRRL